MAACYWKRATREGAIASILAGVFSSLFWLIFVFGKTATSLGICKFLTGYPMLISTMPWPYVDTMIIALPISIIFLVVVSLLTKPLDEKYTIKIHNKVIKMSKHKYFLLVFFTSIVILFLSFLLVFAFAYPKHLTDMLLGFPMFVSMVGIQLMLLSAVLKHIK